ncbi:MAG TPA: sugar ABC transporter ATP-binding protein [Streptosporangiaceae bacterium]|jgi:ABC-type sugar transport system ATPase subunit
MTQAAAAPRLSLRGISKAFGGQLALRGVGLDVADGEVVGLIGENGAGKSTLLNIACGVLSPDSGQILLDGRPVTPHSYKDANRLGIFRIFQDPALIDELRVYENVFFGWEQLFRTRTGMLGRPALIRACAAALADAGLPGIDVRRPLRELTRGERQRLDIARVIALAERLEIARPVVLFDEPTTALDHEHANEFLDLLGQLLGRASVVFVSHRLPEILRTCSRVVVLKDGLNAGERAAASADEDELHQLMVGRLRTSNYYRQGDQQERKDAGPARIRLRGVCVDGAVAGISLAVSAGEIVGLAGTDGSGKRELGEAISGARPVSSGQVLVDGTPLRPGIGAAVAEGIAYVPPDRLDSGLIAGASVVSNVQLVSLADRFATRIGGVWRRAAARAAVSRVSGEFGIVSAGIDAGVATLSGGNQQKVLLAKWLVREPRVVVLDNPTQGVDTGAREGIYRLIRDLADRGTAVILISDDLPELIGLSNRIAVVTLGRVVAEIPAPARAKPGEHEVVRWMLLTAAPDSNGGVR